MNEDLFNQMNRALGGGLDSTGIQAMSTEDIEAVGDAQISTGGTDTDPVSAAMARAVQQESGGSDNNTGALANSTGTQQPDQHPLSSSPPTTGLNWGTDGDEQLTAWLQSRLNS